MRSLDRNAAGAYGAVRSRISPYWEGRRINRPRLLVTTLVVALLATVAVAAAAPGSPIVATDKGPIRGLAIDGMEVFRGIPYAAPPVGDLRWRPPQDRAPWDGVLNATQFANHCPQNPSPYGIASLTEDCLYLNVFTPSKTNEGRPHLLPVMVWIHGGGLFLGESDGYDASPLVGEGVVVVTINYRLGTLGVLAHPALSAESSYGGSGNWGLMDQQAALRWVQRNIRAFGGDPENVTIFGESAGGYSVHAQLASPQAAGLFHKAIVESGAYSLTQSSLATAEAQGNAFASTVGCTDAACLRALSVAAILQAGPRSTVFANIDGFVLTQSMLSAMTSGQFNQVPTIVGSNHDEWRLFIAQAEKATGTPLSASAYPGAIAAIGIPGLSRPNGPERVPPRCLSQPQRGVGRRGNGRGVLVQHGQVSAVALPVRPHVPVRVRRRAGRDAVHPSADQFPDRRLPRLGARVHLRPVADSCAVPRLHSSASAALRHDGELLDAVRENG